MLCVIFFFVVFSGEKKRYVDSGLRKLGGLNHKGLHVKTSDCIVFIMFSNLFSIIHKIQI